MPAHVFSLSLCYYTRAYHVYQFLQGTLLGLVSSLGYVDANGDFPRSRWAYSADAMATIIGSLFGLSPVTSYIESGAGVEAGARTGLTAIFVAFYFFLSIFFAPIIASIPPWATGGALVVVGALMARSLGQVQWHNPLHAVTAFITVMMMPLTYSIAYGLISGIGTYMFMWTVFKLLALLGIKEPNFDDDEATVADMPASDKVEQAIVERGDGGDGKEKLADPDEVNA
jgi:adenine/guanine/hypoxanthine permease